MDPEIQSQLEEQLREMSELLSQQNSAMAAQISAMNALSGAVGAQSAATTNATNAEKDASKAVTGNAKKAEAASAANALIKDANDRFSRSLESGKTAVIGFASAMLDVTPGMAKYASSIKDATGAVGDLVGGFGLVGSAASGLLKIFSGLVTAGLQYSDALVKGYDDVSKMGGAIGSSAEGIMKLGHNAGLSSQNLELFTKNAASLGSNIRSLGKTTSGGVDAFGRMIDVGERNLQQYRKLGYTQGDLIEAQARYVDLQAKAGADLKKSPQEVQKASLKYIDNLNVLSELTGLSAKKQQDMLDAALAQENFNAHIAGLEADKEKAIRDGNTAEAARLEKVIEAKKEYAMFAQQFGPEKANAILEAMSTNGEMVVTESTAMLALSMPEVANQVNRLNQGVNQTAELIDSNNKSVDRFRKDYGELGTAFGKTSRDFQGIMGVDNQSRQMRARYANMSAEDLKKERARLAKQQEEKKNQAGGAMAERAAIEAQERAARLKFDEILAAVSAKLNDFALKMMPLVNQALEFLAKHLNTVGTIFKGLAITLGVLAGAAGIGKIVSTVRAFGENIKGIFGGKKGELGSSANNALHVKLAGGPGPLGKLPGGGGPGDGGPGGPGDNFIDKMTGNGKAGGQNAVVPGTSGPKKDNAARFRDASGKFAKAPVSKPARFRDASGKFAKAPASKTVVRLKDAFGKFAKAPVSKPARFRDASGKFAKAPVSKPARFRDASGKFAKAPVSKVDSGISGIQKLSSQPGSKESGDFLMGLARGLEALGKAAPQVIQGSLALSAAIVAIGAAIGGASWILGKTLPSLAGGLHAFDKVNGDNLKSVGIGMAGLGAGILAMGGSSIVDAFGNLLTMFSGDKESPLDELGRQIVQFQDLPIKAEKVKYNAEAFVAFSEAFAKAASLSASATMTAGIADGVAGFFNKEPPFAKFVYFSYLDINAKKTKNNATAFKYFSEAMSSYKGTGMLGTLGALGTALADGAAKFFGVKPPVDQFAYFSNLNIDPKKAKSNAIAFKDFANALSEYKGGPGVLDALSQLVGGGIMKIFDQGGPIEAFDEFSKKDFGPNMEKNADAFSKYAQSIAQTGGGGAFGTGGGGGPSGPRGGEGGGGGGGFGGALQSGLERGAEAGGSLVGAITGSLSAGWSAVKSAVTGKTPTSESDLKKAGLKIKEGDVQGDKFPLDNRILPFAKNIQKDVPGFLRFTSFNDRYHHKLSYNSKHKEGKAVDFTLKRAPTRKEGAALVNMLKMGGATHAIDEYNNPSGAATAGHMHAQFAEKGGVFDGPKTGYPAVLHGSEMVAPLKLDSILMKLAKTPALPAAAETAIKKTSTTSNESEAIYMRNVGLNHEIVRKLDQVIDLLENDNDTQTKILKQSRI